MLLLDRTEKDMYNTINIGDNIIVRVTKISKDVVRIGVEAPSSVPVHRNEVYRRIKAEKIKASNNV